MQFPASTTRPEMPHHHWIATIAAAAFAAFTVWAVLYLCHGAARQRRQRKRVRELEAGLLASQRERLGRQQARLANYQRTLREYGHTTDHFARQYERDVASTRAAIRDLVRRGRR